VESREYCLLRSDHWGSGVNSGIKNDQVNLKRLVREVKSATDTPAIISFLAENPDLLQMVFRILTVAPVGDPGLFKDLDDICSQEDFPAVNLKKRLTPAATVLGLPNPEEATGDFYEVLGVSLNDPEKAIRKAYLTKARDLHPDIHPHINPREFALLAEAYRVLSDPDLRKAYDARHQKKDVYWAERSPAFMEQAERKIKGHQRQRRRMVFQLVLLVVVMIMGIGIAVQFFEEQSLRDGPSVRPLPGSGVRGRESGVRGRESVVGSRESGVRGQGSGIGGKAEKERVSKPEDASAASNKKETGKGEDLGIKTAQRRAGPQDKAFPPKPVSDGLEPSSAESGTPGRSSSSSNAVPVKDVHGVPPKGPDPAVLDTVRPSSGTDDAGRLAAIEMLAKLEEMDRKEKAQAPVEEKARPGSSARTHLEVQKSPENVKEGLETAPLQEPGSEMKELAIQEIKQHEPAADQPVSGAPTPLIEASAGETPSSGEPTPKEKADSSAAKPEKGTAEPPAAIPLDRIQDFLKAYCRAYETLNYSRFMGFFAKDAVENDRSVKQLEATYRDNFERLDSLVYSIEVGDCRVEPKGEGIEVSGQYRLEWRFREEDWQGKKGPIVLGLIPVGGSFQVKRLVYK